MRSVRHCARRDDRTPGKMCVDRPKTEPDRIANDNALAAIRRFTSFRRAFALTPHAHGVHDAAGVDAFFSRSVVAKY